MEATFLVGKADCRMLLDDNGYVYYLKKRGVKEVHLLVLFLILIGEIRDNKIIGR